VQLRLMLQSAAHALQSTEELELSLGAAAAATRVDASLNALGAASQALPVEVSFDAQGRCVTMGFGVIRGSPVRSSINIRSVTVYGQPVAGVPLSTRVRRGLQAPFTPTWPSNTARSGSPLVPPRNGVVLGPSSYVNCMMSWDNFSKR
jgi:hypothetical protein